MSSESLDVERAVRERYSAAANARSEQLCCAVDYDPRHLEAIPQEILERDYGCGDPTRHLAPGETVLDLGCGGGKICYIAAQVVGAGGRVFGVDMNDEMLALAEKHRATIVERIGFGNVSLHKGKIQDLALDYRKLEQRLAEHPVSRPEDLDALEEWKTTERRERPMIASDSIDVIVSNCVLNLVRPADKPEMFREMHRVLAIGGRAVISDIVCDETAPEHLRADPELWSGCISGAFREDAFLDAFADAGFHGMRVLGRDDEPWRTVEGIEFRSLTVEAHKGSEGPDLDRRQAVIYSGPWSSVTDDDGHTLHRGRRTAVSDKTFRSYSRAPYAGRVIPVPPREDVPVEQAAPFECSPGTLRDPRETKGVDYRETRGDESSCCGPDGGSC